MDKKCKDGDYVEKQNTFAEGEKKPVCSFGWCNLTRIFFFFKNSVSVFRNYISEVWIL